MADRSEETKVRAELFSWMGQLIDGLLKMATLGRHALKSRPTELNPIVDEIMSQLQPEYEGREVEWRIAPLPELECNLC